jgi:hypothetical protein
MKYIRFNMTTSIFIILFFTLTSGLFAQMTGNPAGTQGSGEWTVSLMGTYFTHQVGNETDISNRILLKSTWGILPWLDFYALVGVVQLEIQKTDMDVSDYKDKYRTGIGFGLNVSLLQESDIRPFSLWLGSQALRFKSHASFMQYFDYQDRKYEMTYDWREYKGYGGLSMRIQQIRIYAAGIGWTMNRLESKKEYWSSAGQWEYKGKEKGEYGSDLWTGGALGVTFLLPKRYSIGLELLYFNEYNYQVMIGIYQSGREPW